MEFDIEEIILWWTKQSEVDRYFLDPFLLVDFNTHRPSPRTKDSRVNGSGRLAISRMDTI